MSRKRHFEISYTDPDTGSLETLTVTESDAVWAESAARSRLAEVHQGYGHYDFEILDVVGISPRPTRTTDRIHGTLEL